MAIIGHGSKLVIVGPHGGSAVNGILDCQMINTGSNKVDTPESTSMLSPGTSRTYEPGLEDAGEITVKFFFDPTDAGQVALYAAKGKKYDFKIVYPGGMWEEVGVGIAQGHDTDVPDDKNITRTVKIKKTGVWTEDEPAPTVSYATPQTYAHGAAITPLVPTTSGEIDSFSVSPSLPAAMSLDTVTGIISGTPSATTAAADYTVTAHQGSVTATAIVHITIS
jgi:hypothetical protein